MTLLFWRKKQPDPAPQVAIHEARTRAVKTKTLLEQEAVMAERFRTQRQSNGFVEMIENIYAPHVRRQS